MFDDTFTNYFLLWYEQHYFYWWMDNFLTLNRKYSATKVYHLNENKY